MLYNLEFNVNKIENTIIYVFVSLEAVRNVTCWNRLRSNGVLKTTEKHLTKSSNHMTHL